MSFESPLTCQVRIYRTFLVWRAWKQEVSAVNSPVRPPAMEWQHPRLAGYQNSTASGGRRRQAQLRCWSGRTNGPPDDQRTVPQRSAPSSVSVEHLENQHFSVIADHLIPSAPVINALTRPIMPRGIPFGILGQWGQRVPCVEHKWPLYYTCVSAKETHQNDVSQLSIAHGEAEKMTSWTKK